jgi:hypothetical protein
LGWLKKELTVREMRHSQDYLHQLVEDFGMPHFGQQLRIRQRS